MYLNREKWLNFSKLLQTMKRPGGGGPYGSTACPSSWTHGAPAGHESTSVGPTMDFYDLSPSTWICQTYMGPYSDWHQGESKMSSLIKNTEIRKEYSKLKLGLAAFR